MKLKKSFILVMIIALICVLTACGKDQEKKNHEMQQQNENQENTIPEEKIKELQQDYDVQQQEKKQENSFSEAVVKKSLQDYLDLVATKEGRIASVLVKLGLLGAEEIKDTNDDAEDGYVKTNIKYSDYKNAMLNYVTEDIFNNQFSFGFKNKDGFLYYHNGGATGSEYRVDDIRIKGDYSDFRYIGDVVSMNVDDSEEKMNVEFGVTNYKGKCVIDYCDI